MIERKRKPAVAWGRRAQTAFGPKAPPTDTTANREQLIVALGRQDIDPDGLVPPAGLTILGTSSDHLVLGVDPGGPGPAVGDEVRFGLDYSSLLRAMTSPFVDRAFVDHH